MKQADLFGAPPAPPAEKAKTEPVVKQAPAAAAPPVPAWRRAAPAAPEPEAPRVLSVSELTGQIKGLLERTFTRVLVRGEVANYRGPNARGHLYFNLKDADATLPVVLWSGQARALKFQLQEGLGVVVEGALSLYAPHGAYRLTLSRIEPEGIGALALQFEQLKQKLAAEGLIGPKRARPPRPIPFLPRRIGVVTSLSGAALRDFLKVLYRRHPRLSVLVADARVQGDGAADDVCRALQRLSRTDVDVIVVTRGGGSIEDLWTFNEERVVRAMYACRVPVVSAIGHEIDTTLADLVADLRAPTPSAAAEALAPVLSELELSLATWAQRLRRAMGHRVERARRELGAYQGQLGDPRARLNQERFRLEEASKAMERALGSRQRRARAELAALATRLQAQRPSARLRERSLALAALRRRLEEALRRRLAQSRTAHGAQALALARHSPAARVGAERQRLGDLSGRLTAAPTRVVARERQALASLGQALHALSPLAVLGRGYALASRADGRVVRAAADVSAGDALRVRLGGGDELAATVTQVHPAHPKPR